MKNVTSFDNRDKIKGRGIAAFGPSSNIIMISDDFCINIFSKFSLFQLDSG